MDFEPGEIRVKASGSHGRHNGVKSVMECVGSDFTRIRVGIGKPKSKEQGLEYVLGKFTSQERKTIDDAIITAMSAVEHIIEHGRDSAMNLYNRKI
jgi:peptidyl-tRNA hydrolase, PTH1 family